MDIDKLKGRRKITIWEFIEYAAGNGPALDPRRHLARGDYLVFPDILKEDFVCLDVIVGIDQPEEGDFVTKRDITGPIRGNIFIQRNNGILLVGNQSYVKGSVPERVERYYNRLRQGINALGEDVARRILPLEYERFPTHGYF